MNFGLRAKLNLISFLPIMVIVFIASYYVYSSYVTFQASQALQAKVTQNELLNDLITKIARERGMTSIFLGSHSENIATSLKGQRTKVDESLAHFKASLESHKNDTQMQHAKTLLSMLEDINGVRAKVDAQTVEFNAIFSDYYSNIEHTILKNLSRITQFELDREVKTLATLYLNLAHAKEFTSAERDFIGFLLSQNAPITDVQLNHWVSLLGRADAIGLEQIADVESLKGLYTLFMTADAQELFEDITTARTHISQMASSGEYEIEASEWFEMIGEKIRLLDEAEAILLEQINTNAKETQKEQLRILIIALVIWVAAILVAILGRVLSNQLLVNIKNLESLLKRVANSVALEKEPINLDTAKGVNQAYAMLERIIEESNEARHNALQASEAKSMFLANMSHEIRTPLNGIVGFTDLLRDTHLDQEQQEFIDIIQKSSENLLEIINNILDVSKIESNKIEIESIPFTPLAEFESAVEVYSVRASEKRINLASFIDPSLEYPLKGDPTKIKEVILNLLSNAVKFTQPNGQISVSIKKLDSVDGCATLFFEVTDSGIGVSIEQQSKIFEAFSQADTSITRKYGGTGLGLTISSRFVELMGGKLDLNSTPGQGTTFFFTLKLEEIASTQPSQAGCFGGKRALFYTNPNYTKRQEENLREYLAYYDVAFDTFDSVPHLLKLQATTHYDLIIVDYEALDDVILERCTKTGIPTVLIAKSIYLKEIDALGFRVFKTLFEPITATKVHTVLDMVSTQKVGETKPESAYHFDSTTSAFNARILVAEDNIINQKLIKRTLEEMGATVTLASNGLEAFEKRKNSSFDLIFMDIQMPVLDGMEATQEILEYEADHFKPHIPIIALTANALKGDRERFLGVGMDEYTTKPLVRENIIALLKQFIGHTIITLDEAKALEPAVAAPVRTILIAKKTRLENSVLSQMVTNLGYRPLLANGRDALMECITKEHFDAVLFDKELLGLDVKQFSDTIRARDNNGAILLMTYDPVISTLTDENLYVHETISEQLTQPYLLALLMKHFQG